MNASDATAPPELIIDARWLLPIAPVNTVLEHHSVVIRGGIIERVAPTAELARVEAGQRLVLDRHAVLPGLVNAHGHAAMSLLRGLADDQPLDRWLNEHIWPTESRWVCERFVRDGTELAIAEMLKSGTTCFSDMYFYPEASAEAARAAGIRAQVLFPLIQFPNAWSNDTAEAFHKGLALHDAYRDDPLVRIGFGPHAPYTVPEADLVRALTLADELDAPMHIHLHETAAEVEAARSTLGISHIEWFQRLGLLVPRLQAVHMTQVSDAELALIADAGVGVVHCPQSNLKLASGLCDVMRLGEAGVTVGLGTDGAASNDGLDLFAEMRAAALLAKALRTDPSALDALSLLEMATLGGARVLERGHEIGSVEAGKAADLIAVDLGGISRQPVYQPQAQLIYTTSGTAVSHVWVGGRALVAGGRLLTQDEDDILARAKWWGERIAATASGAAE